MYDGNPGAQTPTADEIITASKNYMAAVSGVLPDVARDPGLLITAEDIREVRRYIKFGLQLPTDDKQVAHLLGDGYGGVPGLEPATIRELYEKIIGHCQSWAPIESDMKKVGTDLNVFASNLVTVSRNVVEFIRGLESYRTLKLEHLSPEQLANLPPVALVPGEEGNISALSGLFDEMRGLLKKHSASTHSVSDRVSSFKDVLKLEISPSVSLRVKLVSTKETNATIIRLTASIRELTERIQQKNDEYSTYVRNALIGLWWGPLGVAITGTVYGVQAEQVRKERNALLEEKAKIEKQLKQLNTFLNVLLNLESSLQNIELSVEGAVGGISSLESIWMLMAELIDSSQEQLQGLSNSVYLVILASRFERVISHWSDIKKQTFDLLTAFDKALAERRV